MHDDRLHTRVGLGVLFALALAVTLVLVLQGRHLRPGIRVKVEFEHLGPLAPGTPIRISGKQVGTVDGIRLAAPRVVLDCWIERRHAWMVRRNSEVFVNQPSVLGEAYLEVGPPRGEEPGPPIADGDTLRGVDPPRIDRLLQKSYENLLAVSDLLRNGLPEARELGAALDELGRTLDALEPEPGAYVRTGRAVAAVLDEVESFSAALSGSGTSAADVAAAAARVEQTLSRAGRELAGIRARLDVLLERLSSLTARVGPDRLARLELALARARDLAAQAERISGEAAALATQVVQGRGTIGAFLGDTELFDDVKAMMKLMKSQPWRTIGTTR